jgi:hypothetical protein
MTQPNRTAPPAASSHPPTLADGIARADWILRVTILVYALGVAVAVLTRSGSALGDLALMHSSVGHAKIFLWERIVAGLLFVAALSLLAFPTVLALVIIGGITALEAYAAHRAGGFPFAEYTPLAVALRYLTPLALVPLVLTKRIAPSRRWRSTTASWILRIAVAIVFFIHGLEALWLHPGFIDLIIGSARNVLGLAVTQTTAAHLLRFIGIVDIAIAILILVHPWKPLLGWICFWGLITALARPMAHGFGAYPEVLLRSSHILAAVAIGWLLYGPKTPADRSR